MAQMHGGSSQRARTSERDSPTKTIIVVIVVILALAAAVFSITRTVRSGQGRNMGTLGGFEGGKGAMMKEQMPEPGPGTTPGARGGVGAEEPAGSGMESPPSAGGKGSGR